MEIIKYSEWKDTAVVLHLISQMIGKVKLARMETQPEWNHALLEVNATGFSSGLITNGEKSFQINVLIAENKVETIRIDGRKSSFTLEDGKSISTYYQEFDNMLYDVMCETEIYSMPQETNITTLFEKDDQPRVYDPMKAKSFFEMCVFAYNVQLNFIARYRNKKILPSFFWGTFDVSCALFNGIEHSFNAGGIIEKVAFDEQMVEFGFWPGDDNVEEPTFFILAYPFITNDLTKATIKPDKAYFSPEKSEFFITLRDIMSYDNPEKALIDFYESGFDIIINDAKWSNLEWFTKPLLTSKGSEALK